ncbi:hypothetical protein [Flavobacterium sp. TAB 87]|uniref:hypothetical protein n=1 Tax=Flavobacterium sp. TAB 87 TaxID=1729581 RepID=UPI00076C5FDA|nr:hypothetical protein [Flavobacterium sp. TAB 87]KVV15000.1 hypothetical protein AP058_01558 [Flavobacterium sp. TAB 87]
MRIAILIMWISFVSFSKAETNVYICGNKGAKKYHYKENCRGLSACTQGVKKTGLTQAKGFGLTICGWEN